MDAEETAAAGRMAEDMFVRQMRRRRAMLDLSQSELAERVSRLGGSLYQQTIAKIESGQRAVRLQEADLIAQALGTTVSGMLSQSIDSATNDPEEMDVAELVGRAKSAQRQREEAAVRLAAAQREEAEANEATRVAQVRLAAAAEAARHASAELQMAEAELKEITRASLKRQSEMNAAFGPRWGELMSLHPPITREQLLRWNREHLEQMKETADSGTMNSRDREVLMKSIEDLENRLKTRGDEE
ncbi:helix-turn-helix transcriptional regulator [Streptomyces shenzhenensis]|uniref:helix-turn-helix transcriptional regulator n=1 Tax=Streptomyces shenzhenensis TaxID=943815 RepID=UPI0033EB9303